jgi:carboxymethylenebutenolidase
LGYGVAPLRLVIEEVRMPSTRDLGAVFDEHLRDEFELHDAAATMETMSAKPHLYHVPTMAGGNARDEIFKFYRDHFVTKWPADTSTTRVSRTIGEDQLVDELVMTFTHDVVMDALLPGVAPSGRHVSLPVVVVVKFHEGKVAHEHIYWDQASLLAQVGLLNQSTLPITGAEQAHNLLNGTYATNALLTD